MNTNTIRLFDNNHNLIDNFDTEIEKVLISIHGENYFDIDEPYQDTRELKKVNISVNKIIKTEEKKTETKKTIKITDFIPVSLYIFIFALIIFAGYNILNSIDLMEFIK